ncbi:GGDEF domain-containing protein [Blastococcus tunisiensis]|uniref:Diguanylate cyclase (GGDEF) domain-containing protein n=1 Tax=Blastococcus tunisiensis TaxID=1798228 RepID=A0A1I2I1X9_9ACTN|nr:GGDEF domain-containing protein [Blastococcus sp. DSM 46838]SFF36184.1 diguanylate cyclase (GGDEF) domain-containing protein [Blastococcus sp. DSM 46838]
MLGLLRTRVRPRPAADPGRDDGGRAAAASSTAAAEFADRTHKSALLVAALATVVAPAWSVFDLLLEPRVAGSFVVLRFACLVPMLALVWLLWRRPVGRRRPELLAVVVLAIVQAEISWMLPRVANLEFYLLGFTLAIYASGCLLVARTTWTGLLVLLTWCSVLISLLTAPTPMPVQDLLATVVYLATASTLGLIAHRQRYAFAMREFRTRLRLDELLLHLERQSHEDPLTGLANRRHWDSALLAACEAAREDGTPVAVVLADLDHFKRVNDHFGHAGGDEALRLVAGLLRERVRADDLVARLGGDELALLLPGADLERARAVAESVRLSAARLRPSAFPGMRITLSLGVAVATGGQTVPPWLMSDADDQLYRAKSTRNAVSAALVHPAAGRDTTGLSAR